MFLENLVQKCDKIPPLNTPPHLNQCVIEPPRASASGIMLGNPSGYRNRVLMA
jgi:hypothetical protein